MPHCCGFGSVIRCLLNPWIRDRFFLDSGPRILDPKPMLRALTIFGVKVLLILCKLAQIFFFTSHCYAKSANQLFSRTRTNIFPEKRT
jgi:hypothetical protein